jgi:starvation-inducible DNA-binding protein
MHKTSIDLPSNARQTVITILNARLADTLDLALATKHAHWNVKGPHFIALHEMFDKFVPILHDAADEMAERVTALGGTAEGTVQQVAGATKLAAYPTDVFDGMATVRALADRYAALGKSVRANIDEAAEAGEADAADILTGLSRELDKALWFLEAHVQASR